jgi:hypothetical protein
VILGLRCGGFPPEVAEVPSVPLGCLVILFLVLRPVRLVSLCNTVTYFFFLMNDRTPVIFF